MKHESNRSLQIILVLTLILAQMAFAGTTGKLTGRVINSETGEALPFSNVVIEGTTLGGAADADGYFIIINIPPGTYNINAIYLGYAKLTIQNVRILIDQTTNITCSLQPQVMEGQEVTIVAQRALVEDDVATSVVSMSGDEINSLPVTSISEAAGLQAGVEEGFVIRGGSASESLFLVDNMTLRDPRNNKPITGLPLSAVSEISVERGGFSAEYGQVRAGIVNIVTKDGPRDHYEGSVTYRYSPAAPKYFGISPFDKNSLWMRPYLDDDVAWEGTGNGAWDEYTRRQYADFDGWNAVSQRLLEDSDPDNDLTPKAAQRKFIWERRAQPVVDKGDYTVDIGFGGPVPVIGKKLGNLRFFSAYRTQREMLLVPLTRDDYLDYDFMVKLTSEISPSIKLDFTSFSGKSYNVAINESDHNHNDDIFGIGAKDFWDVTDFMRTPDQIAKATYEYRSSRIFSNSWYSDAQEQHSAWSANLVHTLSATSFYDVSIEYVKQSYLTGPVADRDETDIVEIVPGYGANEAPFGYSPLPESGIAGDLFGGHSATPRDSSESSFTTIKASYTTQVNKKNLLKAGGELVLYDMHRKYGHMKPYFGDINWNDTHEKPIQAALYIQDKLEAVGFILDAGLRLDYYDSNIKWANVDVFDPYYFTSKYDPDEDYNLVQSKPHFSLSPRMSLSHPITTNSKLFFNYGHFKQQATYDEMLRVGRKADNGVASIGNPELPPEQTISYELGYDQVLFNTVLLQAAAFYHDITNQQDWTRYLNASGTVAYERANSNNYEDIRGLEVSLRVPKRKYWSAFVNYTFQVTTEGNFGFQQIFENPQEQMEYNNINQHIYQRKPVPEPFGRAGFSLHAPNKFGPKLMGLRPLGGWNVNVVTNWEAGEWRNYTPRNDNDAGLNLQVLDELNVDLKLNKTFPLREKRIQFFVEVDNLLNTKHLSGASFYDALDLVHYMNSLHLPEDPANYDNIVGNDRPGDYRDDDVDFQPIETVGSLSNFENPNPDVIYWDRTTEDYWSYNAETGLWNYTDSQYLEEVLEEKAYIDMPNQTSFNFLNPRQIFFGVDISFDLGL